MLNPTQSVGWGKPQAALYRSLASSPVYARPARARKVLFSAEATESYPLPSLHENKGFAPSGELLSLCLCKEKVTKEKAPPTFGPGRCAPGVRSLHRRSRGSQRWAVHGPAQLSRHPCRSTPSSTTTFTLLKGLPPSPQPSPARGEGVVRAFLSFATRQAAPLFCGQGCFGHAESPSGGREEVLRRGTRGMDAERGTMGQGRPIVTAPGAAPERGKSERSEDPYAGVPSFAYFSWASKKSKAPCKAQPVGRAEESAAPYSKPKPPSPQLSPASGREFISTNLEHPCPCPA